MTDCSHLELRFDTGQQGIRDSHVRYMDLRITCAGCGRPVLFHGLPLGVSTEHPTMNVDRRELRIPFTFDGEVPAADDPDDINRGKIVSLRG